MKEKEKEKVSKRERREREEDGREVGSARRHGVCRRGGGHCVKASGQSRWRSCSPGRWRTREVNAAMMVEDGGAHGGGGRRRRRWRWLYSWALKSKDVCVRTGGGAGDVRSRGRPVVAWAWTCSQRQWHAEQTQQMRG